MKATREAVDKFLRLQTIAVIGVSNNQHKFGTIVYNALKKSGKTVYPVNLKLDTFDGGRCYHSIAEVRGKIDGVITVVPPHVTEKIVEECHLLGIRSIWMQTGSSSKKAIDDALEKGMNPVFGECILMFLEPVTSLHKFHRFVKKVFGSLPR